MLTIHECMSKLSEIVDDIVIVDNGSTDGTIEAYDKYSKIKKVLHTVGFNEGRDKIMVLDEAKRLNPDWILWIDADEVFENNFSRSVVEKYMCSKYNRITFRMCNFWLDRIHCRYDNPYYLYTLHPQRSMWRNMSTAYFFDKKIHNGDIQGVLGKSYISPYRLKHFGYSDADKMRQKKALYIQTDSNSSRDYPDLDPDKPFKSFVFKEFGSPMLNYSYIIFYKYLCNFLWIVLRVQLKFKK
jgi:glycosyltransferase involved in cell wall biosynthesis